MNNGLTKIIGDGLSNNIKDKTPIKINILKENDFFFIKYDWGTIYGIAFYKETDLIKELNKKIPTDYNNTISLVSNIEDNLKYIGLNVLNEQEYNKVFALIKESYSNAMVTTPQHNNIQ